MGLDYQIEVSDVIPEILAEFHSLYYLRINQRRQEHLASLGLDLWKKSVWEVSAGIGDHTTFFLDRNCMVTCTEVRPELVEVLATRFPDRVNVGELNLEDPNPSFQSRFDIVYCYGLLYHLRSPGAALEFMAERCGGQMLLETCVSLGHELTENLTSEAAEYYSQAFGGIGCRPTRAWVFKKLKLLFPHVYVPRTQPNHEQFPIRWENTEPESMLSRAIFIASRTTLDNPLLAKDLLQYQARH